MKTLIETPKSILYLIYDGDCMLCRNSAQAIRIKKSIGILEIINARSSHPLVKEALDKGYNLNTGIVVKYSGKYFHGADAVHLLALFGSKSDLFNRINQFLFKFPLTARLFYPVFKLIRNLILFLRKIPPIPMPPQKPLFKKIYKEQTKYIPPILQKRYFNRPFSSDVLILTGEMNITTSKIFRLLSPLFRLVGALVPYEAKNIPASVELISNISSDEILMRRTFYYPDNPSYIFSSSVIHLKNNVVIELIRFRIAARLIYTLDNNKIVMEYGGYVLCLGKKLIPFPLGFLIGKFYAYEEAVADDKFNMLVRLTHPIFGTIFQYEGYFKIAKCNA